MEAADFSGYATKAGLRCSDGRTITAEAFKHMDGMRVPLVWQHGHDKPDNVLGHTVLEARSDGMYAYGFFNDTPQGQNARVLVQHEDIKSMSIFANQLVEKSKSVLHGQIREVSLVLAGANPGAVIDFIKIQHSADPDDIEVSDEDAIIHTGLAIEHQTEGATDSDPDSELNQIEAEIDEVVADSESNEIVEHAAGEELTVQEIYNSMDDDQKAVLHMMVEAALEKNSDSNDESVSQSATENDSSTTSTDTDAEGNLIHQEGNTDMGNVFEQDATKKNSGPTLSHADLETIQQTAAKNGGSLKAALEEYALAHAIEDIDVLFPDAQLVGGVELHKRRTEWVNAVIDGARKSPFSRIKSLAADLTADEARAKGYVKGNLKKEEIVKLLKRVTTPTTIYKKQKLDRDDVVDITDVDVVAWLKAEMRLMLEEELARAVLIGDGREPDDEDKIDEDKLRPIAYDHEMYAHPVNLPTATNGEALVEAIVRSRKNYKGTGTPVLFTMEDVLTDMLLAKDKMGRRLYPSVTDLQAALRVSAIIPVEVMEDAPDILAVMVNMADYTIGADRGGAVSLFDDFDIDYNQLKYLIETRASGTLTKPKSALVFRRTSGTTVSPQAPAYNTNTNVLTIPSITGVEYYDVTDTTGPGTLMTPGNTTLTRTTDVEARPASGYNFPHNTDDDYTFAVTS